MLRNFAEGASVSPILGRPISGKAETDMANYIFVNSDKSSSRITRSAVRPQRDPCKAGGLVVEARPPPIEVRPPAGADSVLPSFMRGTAPGSTIQRAPVSHLLH